MSDFILKLIETQRRDERDKIFSAMDTLLCDRRTWNSVDIFNIDDFKQGIIIEIDKKKLSQNKDNL